MANLAELKAEFRVALEHQRLLDRNIYDPEAHEYHVFDFKSKVLSLVECLLGDADPDGLLHPSIEWRTPRSSIHGIQGVKQYLSDLSALKDASRIRYYVDPDLIMISDEKAFATINILPPGKDPALCLLKVTKEFNENNPFEKHRADDRIQSVEATSSLKEMLSADPVQDPRDPQAPSPKQELHPPRARGRPRKDCNLSARADVFRDRITTAESLFFSAYHVKTSSASLTSLSSSSPLSMWSDSSPLQELAAADAGRRVAYGEYLSPNMDDFDRGGLLFDGATSSECHAAPNDFKWVVEQEIVHTEEV